jgi:hypothetical protein
MPTGTQGLYRSEATSGARYARVKHRDEEVDIPEAQYRAEGHQPVFDAAFKRRIRQLYSAGADSLSFQSAVSTRSCSLRYVAPVA